MITNPTVLNHSMNGDVHTDIFSAMLDSRSIILTGTINDDMAASIMSQLLYLEAISPDKPITMIINSPGGEVNAGLAIYDTMRHVRCVIHTLCIGQACSMAAVLLSAGDERSILPSSRVMIHQPSGGVQGKESDITITAREITRIREMLVDILAVQTGKDEETVSRNLEKDYWMSAEEAVAYGICDKVLQPQPKEREEN